MSTLSSAGLDKKIYTFFRKRLVDWLQFAGKTATVGAETVEVLMYDAAGDILLVRGTTVPTNTTTGYAKGAIFIKTDAGAGVRADYKNNGTNTSCLFEVGAVAAPGDITLAVNKLIIGSIGGVGAAQTMGGDATIVANGTLTIAAGAVTFAKMQDVDAYSIPVRAGAAAGVLDELAVGLNTVVGRVAANIVAASLVNAQVSATAGIELSKLEALASGRIIVGSALNVPTAVAMGGDASINAAGTLTIADNAISNAQLEDMDIGTVKVGGLANEPTDLEMASGTMLVGDTGAIPRAEAIAANEIPTLRSASGRVDGFAITRLQLVKGGAAELAAVTVAAGDIVTANATDVAVVAIAAGEVVVGATGPVIDGVALTDGSMLIGDTGATPAALTIAVNEVLYNNATTLAALSLPRKSLLTGGAATLQAVAIAAGDVVSADGSDIVAISIAAGEVMVGATGPVIDGVALATGSVLIGATGATPVALEIAVNEVLYRIAAGTLDGLSLPRKNLLTGGAANLQAIAVTAGDIVSANANDIAVVSIAAGEVVVGATGPVIDGVALATYAILVGATGATPAALAFTRGDVLRAGAADLESYDAKTANTFLGGDGTDVASCTVAGDLTVSIAAGVGTFAIGEGKVNPAMHKIITKTEDAVDAAYTVTAAVAYGGYLRKTGNSGGYNITLPDAADIQALAEFPATVGAWFDFLVVSDQAQIATLIAGAGMDIVGDATIPAQMGVLIRIINTGANTVDAVVVLSA